MAISPPELKDRNDLFGWAKRVFAYLRSTVLRSGPGVRVSQTDAGITVSLANHSGTHAPGGGDEIKFQTLEVVWTDPNNPATQKRIIFNPNWSDFQAGRIFSVNDAGTLTGWRTLLDLLDGLTGFAAGKALKVNSAATGLEFGDAGSELPANVVKESTATPFQAGKLVLASATAHELLGTLMGINLAGEEYEGYGDSDISTDARVAQIADARFNSRGGIIGTGAIGGIAVFSADNIIGSDSFGNLFISAFPVDALVGGIWIFCYNDGAGVFGYNPIGSVLSGVTGFAANKVLKSNSTGDGVEFGDVSGLPTGTIGQVLYHNGSAWVVLAKPSSTQFLKNAADGSVAWANPMPAGSTGQILYHNGSGWVVLNAPGGDQFLKNTAAGAVQWASAPAATVQSSGGTGASLVTADGKIKTIYGD